ncbi:sugar transporter SWEET1-like isoform X2 [Limulus polyphemus]|uniref:Sugar transporter SWEET1 n=1 Tax=Limulus polyphemus TaxID=6850 RepID=A0ABM1TLZ3_LIMPO|nr:sugar transporter SWEET1-like isoform X2 [Limulus polyphemus]
MDLKTILGNAATVCTVASFFSGAFVCQKIWKKGTTADISPFPFLTGVLCGVLWLRYGLFIQDSAVIIVNTIGLTFQTVYVLWYYIFTLNRQTLHKQLFGIGILLLGLFSYLIYITKGKDEATFASGLMASGASLAFCAAPLSSMADVIKTKSVKMLPFPIILTTFGMTSLWFMYGFMLNDKFIQVPNLIGAMLAGFQLSLFVIYPSKTRTDVIPI